MDIHKLIGKENVVFVIEDSLEFVSARRGIDLVVDREEFSGGDFRSIVAIKCFHLKLLSGAELGVDSRKLVLRQTEKNGDRLQLSNDEQAIGIRRVNHVAGIDQDADRRDR